MMLLAPYRRFRQSIALLLLCVAFAGNALAQEATRQQADELYQRGDFAGAADALDKYLAAEPDDDQARMLLGICRQRTGNNEAAEAAFLTVDRRNPGNGQVLFLLALVQFTMGKHGEAESNARKVIALVPEPAAAHHLLGMVLEERNQLEKALASYQQAIKADQQLLDAYLSAGGVLLKLRRAPEALPLLDKAVELGPDFAETHYHRARARIDLGQLAGAEQDLESAVRLQDHPQARSLLARVRSGEFQTAKKTAAANSPKPPAKLLPIRFQNVAEQAGLNFVVENHPTAEKYLAETMTGGVAAFDYDGDGLSDIFSRTARKLRLSKRHPRSITIGSTATWAG